MYIYGKNVVMEYLEKDEKINKAYIYEKFTDKSIESELKRRNICIKYITKKGLDELANGNHQGIILSVPDYEYADIDEIIHDNGFIVILDHIEDPHNFGAIIRTSEAAGVDGIIIPKNRGVKVNSTVIKTSAGAITNVKIVEVTNLVNTINYLKKRGFWIVATDMEGDNYSNIDYNGNIAIVIGNEGSGISDIIRKNSDFIASIPMTGKINSLNASVAAGIVLFKALEKRS